MNKACYYLFGLKLPLYLNFALPALIFYDYLAKLLKNRFFRILLAFALPTIIFVRLLRNDPFFLSDDFAHLMLVSQNSYSKIVTLALRPGGIWVNHRIFVAFWAFKAIYDLFGTKVVPYLAVSYLVQIANVYLFYSVLKKIKNNSILPLITAVIFSSFYLTWISNLHEIIAGTFVLLSLFFWTKFLERGRNLYYWLVIIFYPLTFLSKEIAFLTAPALLFYTVFYNNYVKKVEVRKIVKAFIPIFIVFLFYFLFFASSFLVYSRLPKEEGYRMAFGLPLFFKNLLSYTSMLLPVLKNSYLRFLLFAALAVFIDLRKKKLVALGLFASYVLLITPPSLFETRSSNYYTYIPSIFFFILLFVIFDETYLRFKRFYVSTTPAAKVLKVYSLILILVGVFGLNRILLDNCFLIQHPWPKPYKQAFLSLVERIDEKLAKGQIKEGALIQLDKKEQVPELEYYLYEEVLGPFLKSKESRNFRFRYLPDKVALLVEKR